MFHHHPHGEHADRTIGEDHHEDHHSSSMGMTAHEYEQLMGTKFKDDVLVIRDRFEALGPKDGIHWDKNTTRVLDYACGTGLATKSIASYAHEIIGIDAAQTMVDFYNEELPKQGIDNATAVVGDLSLHTIPSQLQAPHFFNFDVIICSMAFHHIADIPLITARLVERLKPETGVLVVVDRRPQELSDEDMKTRHVAHQGFTDSAVKEYFDGAGLADTNITILIQDLKGGSDSMGEIFIATGRKISQPTHNVNL